MAPTDQVTVVTSALHAEAGKWHGMAREMFAIKTQTAGLTLELSAFFIGDVTAGEHYSAYKSFKETMTSLFDQASTEFSKLGGALDEMAQQYEATDGDSAGDIQQIYA